MKTFDYVWPATVREAVAAASEPGAAYLAAGTNLLDLIKGGITHPSRLIDISHLPGLDQIEHLAGGGVRIGALVRNADLAHDPDFARRFPGVAEALLSGASAQLRNAATVGGNLLQRTRCPYFYDVASACNKRESGAGCEARGGDTRLHAVLGWSESCIATNPSDFCVPLVALDAVVEIEGRARRREVPLENFHRLPGDTPERESVLEPGELIVAVRLPAEAASFRRMPATSRFASAPPTPSRSSRLPPPCNSRAPPSSRRGSRSAVSPSSPGGPARPRRYWPVHIRIKPPFAARPGRRSRTRSRPVTMSSRSSSHVES